jgi:hypothetical protein
VGSNSKACRRSLNRIVLRVVVVMHTNETSYNQRKNKKDMRMHSTGRVKLVKGQFASKREQKDGRHTHIIANATSVTRNLLSTSQSAPTLPTIAAAHPSRPIPGRICRSSARKVKAQRSPHHAAGAVLRARQTRRGTHHFRSTPSITATRGCSAEGVVSPASVLLDV